VKKNGKGFAFRLALLIVVGVSFILGLVLSYNYIYSRRLLGGEIKLYAREKLQATLNRLDIIFFSMEKAIKTLSIPLEDRRFASNRSDLFFLLKQVVRENREVYGSTVAFEPFMLDPHQSHYAPYFYKFGGTLHFRFIPYDYFTWAWYAVPKRLNRAVWVEPYFGKAGGIIMSTYSVPLHEKIHGKERFFAIATVDVSLKWLQNIVSSIKIGKTGYGFLISRKGTFVTHPDSALIMRQTIFDVAKREHDPALARLGRSMIREERGVIPYSGPFTPKPSWIAYGPLRSNGWSLAIIFPKSELLLDIQKLNRRVLLISLVGFALLIGVVVLLARSITRPLKSLAVAAEQIAHGDWEAPLPPVRREDEVGRLTRSFGHMTASLKEYFHTLQVTTAAKERIESELRVARGIQMGLIPKTFPPFPDRKEIDIYAILEPAREVGGDFYDFFFIDSHRLCLVVGDVSGKGVPAALFMAVTKTLIKSDVHGDMDPAAIVSRVNRDLALDNTSLMFVTLFLGIFDLTAHRLTYCNGGHNPPYIVGPDDLPYPLPTTHGMALGVKGDFEYTALDRTLRRGETLVIYTDGVTEAMDPQGNFYGEKRLEAALRRTQERNVKGILEGVFEDVRNFAKEAPQSDDITLLGIRLKMPV
jgi:sigma-B regulation protein RsbU (phosphoserine phosphatase)